MINVYNIMVFINHIAKDDKENLKLISGCEESMEIKFDTHICKLTKENNDGVTISFRQKKTLLFDNFKLNYNEFAMFKNDLQEVFL